MSVGKTVELVTEDEYKAIQHRQYIEDVISRAELAQATGELPFPMCLLPLELRAIAIMISDEMRKRER